MAHRRIDELRVSSTGAAQQIGALTDQIRKRAQLSRTAVSEAIGERISALNARQLDLIGQIDRMANQKIKVLERQLQAIQQGECSPSASQDSGDIILLEADAVVNFRKGEEDFIDKIAAFGNIEETSTYASMSYAKGPGLGILKVNNASYIWVYACDREGKRRTEGGDAVTATLSCPEDFDQVAVEDMKDGRYKVSFVPLQAGEYSLKITVEAEGVTEDIFGGPFNLTVRPPTQYNLLGSEQDGAGKATMGTAGCPHSPDTLGAVHHPCGVEFDHTGRFVFVVDQSNHRIQVFDTETQQPVHTFGKKGLGSKDFDTPCFVVANRENVIVVSDLLNHRLQVLEFLPRTMELRHIRSLGCQGRYQGQFQFPKGMGLTEQGHLFVADSGNHRVQVFDMLEGFSFVREIGSNGTGDGQFVTPLDVVANCSGEILVSDSTNRVQVFDSQGVFLRSFGARPAGTKGKKDGFFNYPTNMAVNDENALFVCDQGNHRVQVVSAVDGSFLHHWGGHKNKKAGEGEEAGDAAEGEEGDGAPKEPDWIGMKCPAGVAVNSSGLVVVSDYHNNTIYSF